MKKPIPCPLSAIQWIDHIRPGAVTHAGSCPPASGGRKRELKTGIRKTETSGFHSFRKIQSRFLVLLLTMLFTFIAHAETAKRPLADAGVTGKTGMDATGQHHHPPAKQKPVALGVDEKTGSIVPGDIRFRDEKGNIVQLGSLVDRPTLLLPVYYECPGVCGLLMSSLAKVQRDLPPRDRGTYRAITVSFDADDAPTAAAHAAATYLHLLPPDFPKADWRFLTGDQHNIDRLLDAIGYRVVKQEKHLFQHPNALIVLSADRKVIRYIYGTQFLPFDIGMALLEAERGTPGISVKGVLSYCFKYDPSKKQYTFQYIRIFGVIIPAMLILFYVFFLRKGNKPKKTRDH